MALDMSYWSNLPETIAESSELWFLHVARCSALIDSMGLVQLELQ